MRRFSINGAVFVFLKKGEKLDKRAVEPSNNWPTQRYVLWPRGEGWDVRYLDILDGTHEWLPIAEQRFPDESATWLAAYNHREKNIPFAAGKYLAAMNIK